MAWMWAFAKRIDDPDIEAGKRGDTFRWQAFDVGRIGQVAKPEAEGRDVAMVLQDRQGPIGPPCPSIVMNRPGTRRLSVAIGGYSLPGGVAKQYRNEHSWLETSARPYNVDLAALMTNKGRRSSMPWVWSACSCVISTPSRPSTSASRSCIRRSGEQSTRMRVAFPCPCVFDQQRTAAAVVLRIVRIARAPAESHARHTHRGAQPRIVKVKLMRRSPACAEPC